MSPVKSVSMQTFANLQTSSAAEADGNFLHIWILVMNTHVVQTENFNWYRNKWRETEYLQ